MDNETKDFFEALKLIETLEARIDKVLAIGPHIIQEDDPPAVILRKESSNELLELIQDILSGEK